MPDQRNAGEKRSGWHYSVAGFIIGAVLLGILLVIEFPKDLWTPSDGGELFRACLIAGLALGAALLLVSPAMYVEDAESR